GRPAALDPPSGGLSYLCALTASRGAGLLTPLQPAARVPNTVPPAYAARATAQEPRNNTSARANYTGCVVKRVLLASPRGYCAGVERAVDTVERLLDLHGPPVYVRKQIVHNAHVVRDLEAR